MTVCFFGSYDPNYARNKILIDGLKKNGVTVLQCRDTAGIFYKRYFALFRKFLLLHKQTTVIYVAFRGHENMPLAWLLGKLFCKPVFFDAFISLYDTYLNDRRTIKKGSLQAKMFYWIDKIGCLLADKVILETKAHREYFAELFDLPAKKFACVYVGGDDTVFRPRRQRRKNHVVVEFHGVFTRLQGVETVLEAFKLLENEKKLQFLLIGKSFGFSLSLRARRLLSTEKPKNLTYIPYLQVEELARRVADADISIGHFGTTRKAQSVFTNKIFHGLASGNAVIVADTLVSRELFVDRENCIFARAGDSQDLAEKIRLLARDRDLRVRIAHAGYRLSQQRLRNKILGRKLLHIIQSYQ